MYRTQVAYKRRKEEAAEAAILWHNQQIQFQDKPITINNPNKQPVRSRSVSQHFIILSQGNLANHYKLALNLSP
jgi:hypothetical protein